MPDQVVVPGADEHGVDQRRVNGRRRVATEVAAGAASDDTREPELTDDKPADSGPAGGEPDVEAGIDQPAVDRPGAGTGENPVSASETGPWRQLLRDQVPFGIVLLVAVAGIVRLVEYHWRQGAVLLGAALLVAAVLRAAFPDERAGLLRVRGRVIDVLSYAALAACMMFVAFTIAGGPLS